MSDQNLTKSNTEHTQTTGPGTAAVTVAERFEFDSQEEFLEKLETMTGDGVKAEEIATFTPFHVHEVDHILHSKPSALRFFSLFGALTGFFASFAFIVFTVFDWPMITGGKPLLSIPTFIVVAFECTILIGGIVSFIGFLHLSRLPNIKRVIDPRDCGNQFIIERHTGVAK